MTKTTGTPAVTAKIDYETDHAGVHRQQAVLLRQGKFNRVSLDFENIAGEIESMGRRERYSIRSNNAEASNAPKS